MEESSFEKYILQHNPVSKIKEAIDIIFRAYRWFRGRRYRKMIKLYRVRAMAATHVQAIIKSWMTRRYLRHIRVKKGDILITWKYKAEKVAITGDFLDKPWAEQISLKFWPVSKMFYTRYFIENDFPVAIFKLKFIVDGEWLWNGDLPISQDMQGNFNNVISFKPERKDSIGRSSSFRAEGLPVTESVSNQRRISPRKQYMGAKPPSNPSVSSTGLKIMRPRSMGDMTKSEIIQFLNTAGSPENLRLVTCGYKIAHPHKGFQFTPEGSADDYFINNELNAFGVADGVGEWENFNVDPSYFPKELIFHCQDEIASCTPLNEALTNAHNKTNSYGSSTAILAQYKEMLLHTCWLGDSACIVLRQGKLGKWFTIFRTKDQQHKFNWPFQLSKYPTIEELPRLEKEGLTTLANMVKNKVLINKDTPNMATEDQVALLAGDIVLAGSDGFFDNMWDDEIQSYCERLTKQTWSSEREMMSKLSEELCTKAALNSLDLSFKSPFAVSSNRAGYSYNGGKPDDTTVVASKAVPE